MSQLQLQNALKYDASNSCKYVVVTASVGNSDYVTVGGSSVSSDGGAILQPGFSVRLDIDDSNLVYAIGPTAGPYTVNVQYFN